MIYLTLLVLILAVMVLTFLTFPHRIITTKLISNQIAEIDKLKFERDAHQKYVNSQSKEITLIGELLKTEVCKANAFEEKICVLQFELFDAGAREAVKTEALIGTMQSHADMVENLDEAMVAVEELKHELKIARQFGDDAIRLKEKIRTALESGRTNWKQLFKGEPL